MGRAIEARTGTASTASQFELLTAGALKLFADEGLYLGGAGGRPRRPARRDLGRGPEAVVLTNVGLDHAEYLGDTVEEISREKLASVSEGFDPHPRDGRPARARSSARERCGRVGARLVEAGDPRVRLERQDCLRSLLGMSRLGVRAAEVLMGRELSMRGARAGRKRRGRGVAGAVRGPRGRRRARGGRRGAQRRPGSGRRWRRWGMLTARGRSAVVFGVLRDKDVAVCLPP